MESNVLKSADLKATKKRQLILATLEEAAEPLTAEDIYLRTASEMHMSISTIYRALGLLTERGVLLKSPSQDGKIYYQLNGAAHKHVIVCRLCDKAAPLEDCPIEIFEREIMRKTGYRITGHSLEFIGICPECAQKNNK